MNKAYFIIISACVMLMPGIYLFQIYRYILKDLKILKLFNLILYTLGIFGAIYAIFNQFNKFSFAIFFASISPIFHWIFLKYYLNRFIIINGREPIDVAFNFNKGLFKDRVFALSYYLVSIYASLIIIGYFLWNKPIK
jgi:hypothetical protein